MFRAKLALRFAEDVRDRPALDALMHCELLVEACHQPGRGLVVDAPEACDDRPSAASGEPTRQSKQLVRPIIGMEPRLAAGKDDD